MLVPIGEAVTVAYKGGELRSCDEVASSCAKDIPHQRGKSLQSLQKCGTYHALHYYTAQLCVPCVLCIKVWRTTRVPETQTKLWLN